MKISIISEGNMIQFIVLILVLSLSACDNAPKIDGSSEDAARQSIQKINEQLVPEKQDEFRRAVLAEIYNDYSLADAMRDPDAFKKAGSVNIKKLDGLTADDVIKLAEVHRVERVKSEIAELELKIAAAAADRAILGKIEVIKSELIIKSLGYRDAAIIGTVVKNNLKQPISRIGFAATYATPGRSVPWKKALISYAIPGGLEPGEVGEWMLQPNMFDGWLHAAQKAPDGVLSMEVIRVEGANTEVIADASEGGAEASARIRALKESIGEKVEKLVDVKPSEDISYMVPVDDKPYKPEETNLVVKPNVKKAVPAKDKNRMPAHEFFSQIK